MDTRAGSIGGTVTMVMIWAVAWASPGMAIEAIQNILPGALPFASEVDMWPQTLGLPGLVGGVLFSVLLLIIEGRRRFDEVSIARSGAWGAVAGLLVGALVVWVLDSGLSHPGQLAGTLVGLATLLGVASGLGSALLFRYVGRRRASALS